jgi:retron-type reverse transcriptase
MSLGSLGGGLPHCAFHDVVSVSNLLAAWNEFKKGKRKKRDVALFELHLENNIFQLHRELDQKIYIHEAYTDFYVCDPKRRHIHKASVRDRVLHQAIFRVLYSVFDKHFIFDSYSSRTNKGTHAGVTRLNNACRKVSRNWRSAAWVLKCDVRKFFDSIDHEILRSLIVKKVHDSELLTLLDMLFASFEKSKGKGLPLGNGQKISVRIVHA